MAQQVGSKAWSDAGAEPQMQADPYPTGGSQASITFAPDGT
jgi:hypothetical protein